MLNEQKSKSSANSNSWNYEDYKKLEELFAWATFYHINKQEKKAAQTQEQIEKMRIKLGFN